MNIQANEITLATKNTNCNRINEESEYYVIAVISKITETYAECFNNLRTHFAVNSRHNKPSSVRIFCKI